MDTVETLRERISRISALARIITLLAMLITPAVFALLLATGGYAELLPLPQGVFPDLTGASGWSHIALVGLAAARPLSFLAALWFLQDLFRRYRSGAVFGPASIRRLQQLGWVLIGIDAVAFLQRLAAGPLLLHLGLTEPFLAVGIGASMSIIGVFVIVIARVMELGRELEDFEAAAI